MDEPMAAKRAITKLSRQQSAILDCFEHSVAVSPPRDGREKPTGLRTLTARDLVDALEMHGIDPGSIRPSSAFRVSDSRLRWIQRALQGLVTRGLLVKLETTLKSYRRSWAGLDAYTTPKELQRWSEIEIEAAEGLRSQAS